jgi:2-pyrone-4,6-dicarboxylate lactonase
MDADWLAFDAKPSRPTFHLPDGTVDAHCHVFGPGNVFPFAPERKYTPCDAGKEELFALRDFLGVSRNVVVQATCHGSDNSAMLDVLRSSNGAARGVATVEPDVSEDELTEMHESGVRGVRFNYVRRLVDPEPDEYYRRIIERIAPLGWHVVVYFEAADLEERWDFFTSIETRVVVDHMGCPDVSKSVDGPDFARFVRLLGEHENIWTKVTCPERYSISGPPNFDDAVPFARRIVEEFPDRVLWGTDWPHPNLKGFMPDDGQIVDFVPRIARSSEQQHKLLVANPARLYWQEG